MDIADTFRLFEQAASAIASGRGCALATVVGVQGSAYRHEGARMLIFADGTTQGAISGGCLESDVAEAALQAIRTGRPRLLRYDMTSDDDELWGLGTGCNGIVEVFIQPLLTAPEPQAPPATEKQPGELPTASSASVGPSCGA